MRCAPTCPPSTRSSWRSWRRRSRRSRRPRPHGPTVTGGTTVSITASRPLHTGQSRAGRAIGGAGRSVVRTLSFFSKWLAEVMRQPALMLSLVVGPFLLLLLFGEGVKLGAPLPKTVLVWPQGQTESAQRISPVRDEVGQFLDIVAETDDVEQARQVLVRGDAELVAVVP